VTRPITYRAYRVRDRHTDAILLSDLNAIQVNHHCGGGSAGLALVQSLDKEGERISLGPDFVVERHGWMTQ
jgi:hypothetical protein